MSKLLTGEALEQRCQRLGIDTLGDIQSAKEIHGRIRLRATDEQLQKRLLEYERSVRESRMWMLALVSSLASLCSAAVAVVAVLGKLPF